MATTLATVSETVPAEFKFPPLYTSADEAAKRRQTLYLRLVVAEYVVLIIAGILTLNFYRAGWYYAVYALVFIAGLVLLLYRTATKPEQDWYKCRALAESVKTTTWQYVMHAKPFDVDEVAARGLFRDRLSEVLKANQHIGNALAEFSAGGEQITPEMRQIRNMVWTSRQAFYRKHRIDDQCNWYTKKAQWNADQACKWRNIGIGIYVAAVILVVLRVSAPDWPYWPIGPLAVCAAAVLGWMQIKKFNELASTYVLTAHEIGLMQDKLHDVDKAGEMEAFVAEAELAFSREHTQWVARQANKYS